MDSSLAAHISFAEGYLCSPRLAYGGGLFPFFHETESSIEYLSLITRASRSLWLRGLHIKVTFLHSYLPLFLKLLRTAVALISMDMEGGFPTLLCKRDEEMKQVQHGVSCGGGAHCLGRAILSPSLQLLWVLHLFVSIAASCAGFYNIFHLMSVEKQAWVTTKVRAGENRTLQNPQTVSISFPFHRSLHMIQSIWMHLPILNSWSPIFEYPRAS
jgi:hypothetical protein